MKKVIHYYCLLYHIDYLPANKNELSLTGGTWWEREQSRDQSMAPAMYKIEVDGKPYLDPIKKFAVSRDCVFAALVLNNNNILIYQLIE